MRKLKRDIIEKPMYYAKFENLEGDIEIVASSNKEIVDYKALKSAYNPLYPDAGKIIKLPENYLYPNERHHLKDFVIVDGKIDNNGNHVIIGFLGTSQKNERTRGLTSSGNPNELKGITKVVIDKNRYHKLIKRSKGTLSNRILSAIQLEEIKEQSKTTANINKSKRFRK